MFISGGIKTNIAANSRIGEEALSVPREQLLADFDKAAITTAEQTAAAIIRGVEKNKRRILVGKDARFMDWVVRHFPSTYERVLGLEKIVRHRIKERSG